MEIFKIFDKGVSEKEIQEKINFDTISDFCESIIVLEQDSDIADIGSVWGEFQLKRDVIKGGLRFALTNCPNALAWTITEGRKEHKGNLVLHLTINRQSIDSEFTEEINEFVDEWSEGIDSIF